MEDSILENSDGATYMSFILDVEIVVKREDARFNLAESLYKHELKLKSDEQQDKNEKEKSKSQIRQEENRTSLQNNNEQIKEKVETHQKENEFDTNTITIEPIFFKVNDGMEEDRLTSGKSVAKIVNCILNQLKSLGDENPEVQEITNHPENNMFNPSKTRNKLEEPVVNGLIEKNNIKKFNSIFMCNYLKTECFDKMRNQTNVTSITSNRVMIDLPPCETEHETLMLNSLNNFQTLPKQKKSEFSKINESKIFCPPPSKPVSGVKLFLNERKDSVEKSIKYDVNLSFQLKKDEKSLENSEFNHIKENNKIITHSKMKVPKVAFIKNNETGIKVKTRWNSCENLIQSNTFTKDNLYIKGVSTSNVLLTKRNFTRKKSLFTDSHDLFPEPLSIRVKEGKTLNDFSVMSKTKLSNGRSRLNKTDSTALKNKRLRRKTESNKTWEEKVTSDTFGGIEAPLSVWGTSIDERIQTKFNYPSPVRYVWKLFRRHFGLRPTKIV